MASTFENDLRLEEIGTGEKSGTWGVTTNTNLELIGDAFGYAPKVLANSATDTLTVPDGTAINAEARAMYIRYSGGNQDCTVTIGPNTLSKVWFIHNGTSHTITFSQGSGTNVAIAAGRLKAIATDGGGSIAKVYDITQNISIPDLFVDNTLTVAGNTDLAAVEFNSLSGTGSVTITDILDEDNMASNSPTKLSTQQSIKAYVDSQVATSDTLTEVLANGNTTATDQKIQFRDSAIYINSSVDGQLDIVADTEIQLTAPTVDLNGNLNVSGTVDGVDIAARDAVLTSTTTTANAALPKAGGAMTGAITTNSTFDGRNVATDGTKLDGIEASADVTDTTNVTAAGALMDSEVTNLAEVKAFDSTDYATAAQGTTANNALPKAGGAMTGAITTNSTFDGRDVATDGTKLDGIEASADVTDTANVTAAGALMDSEVDADIKTLSLPANTTISAYGKTIVDDANASAARTTLGVAIGSNVQAYSSVLQNTTASFLTADETKLDYITVTQAVSLDQMEIDIAALENGMVYKGDWNAGSGSFPGGGSAQTGWFYYVSGAGTVNGISFTVGDNIVATTDNASTSTYSGNWSKHDQTDAVQAVVGLTGSISKSSLLAALNVEDGADVTDTTNVTAAGALMDSEVTNLAQVKAFDTSDYATAAQGTLATNALPKAGGAMTGAITTNSTFDGRDVATDGTKLDGIEASADVTDTANVTSAGALMDSELTNLAAVKAINQSLVTGASPTFAGLTVGGNIAVTGTVDGRDIATNIPASLGTAGQVLTVNSGANAGEWADAGGGADLYAAETTGSSNPTASGTLSIAIGSGTTVSGNQAVGVGRSSTVAGYRAAAFGGDNIASAEKSLALGFGASSSGTRGVAINGAVTGQDSISFGTNSYVQATFATAVGYDADISSAGTKGTALGYGAQVTGSFATALTNSRAGGASSIAGSINQNSTSYGTTSVNTVAFGTQARATNNSAVSIGQSSIGSGYQSSAYGYNAVASGQDSFAGGSSTDATATRSTALGNGAQATHSNATAVGYNAATSATNQVSLGASGYAVKISGTYTLPTADGTNGQVMTTNGSGVVAFADAGGGADLYAANESSPDAQPSATGANAIAIGEAAVASGSDAFAVGSDTDATGTMSMALGKGAQATANYNLAIGLNANATGERAVGIGNNGVIAGSAFSTAIGTNSGFGGSVTATGAGAMALGGSRATGVDSFAAAIGNNTASYGAAGANSVTMGQNARSGQSNAVALGGNSLANGVYSFAFGGTASGSYSVAFNGTASGIGAVNLWGATASGERSLAVGFRAVSSIYGQKAFANGRFTANGDAQGSIFILRSDTTDATAEALTTNNATAGTTNQIVLPNNSAYTFSGTIVGREKASEGTDVGAWEVKGIIRREANAGTTVLVNSVINEFNAPTGWAVALTADTTLGCLKVAVTGVASTNIRWVATINTSEVTYA